MEPDSPPVRLRRPIGLFVVSAVWVGVALYGFYVVVNLYGPQDYTHASFDFGSNNQLLTADTSLRLFLGVVSFVQLLLTVSIVRGGTWSFPVGLLVSVLVLGIYADFVLLYFSAPVQMGLRTPLLTQDLAVGGGFAALVWGYFTRPGVRRYLTRWL